jgi:autophagy-related protein 9
MLFNISVAVFYVFQIATFAMSLPRLARMYRFYTHLLGVPDVSRQRLAQFFADSQPDVQTLPWPEIVRLIGEIRKHNAITSLSNGQAGALADMMEEQVKSDPKKLDAHDVAK